MGRRIVSLDELDHFEMDEDGHLYWQGERVLTDVKLSLSTTANVAVILAAIGTLGGFLLLAGQAAGLIPSPTPTINNYLSVPEPE